MRSMDQNSDQKRNSAHQKPGSRGTRRLPAHQRTLRMTRAQHRLRSRTAAERGWLRTRLTLRTVPFCVLGLSAHKARRPIGVLARRQRRRPMPACGELQGPSLLEENFDREALALSFLSQSVREFRRGVRAQHEVHASYDGIRFDSRKPMFRVPLPPCPTARLQFLRLPQPPNRLLTDRPAPVHRPPPTPVCRLSFRWSQELLH